MNRIKLLGSAGMTLTTIRQFLHFIRGEGPVFEPCDELRTTLRKQILRVEDSAAKLAESRAVLKRFLTDIEAQ